MATIKGLINAKGKSGEIIANNGAYFVDLTNATESSGVYTIPSADIENGDFTLQVGDTLIDKDSGSMLKVATLTPSITASLVFEASSGGGGSQLYQHNIVATYSTIRIHITITNSSNSSMSYSDILNFLNTNGFNSGVKLYNEIIIINTSVQTITAGGLYQDATHLKYYFLNGTGTTVDLSNFTITDEIIPL